MQDAEKLRAWRLEPLEVIERRVIEERFGLCGRSVARTADSLGLSVAAVRMKLQRYGQLEYRGGRRSPLPLPG